MCSRRKKWYDSVSFLGFVMTTVSTSTLGEYFGVSARTVENWALSGVLVRVDRGQFELKPNVRRYCEHMRKSASGRAGTEATSAAKAKSLEASARLRNAPTKAAEMRLKKQAGEVIQFATHETVLSEFFGYFRRSILALHPQISRALHLPPKADDTVRDVVYAALKQMAEADPLDGVDLKLESK